MLGGDTVATTSGAAATLTLPTLRSGEDPKYVLVTVEIGKEVFLRSFPLTDVLSPPADSTLMLVTSRDGPLILNVAGHGLIRHLQKTVGAVFYVTPLANG